MHGGAHAIAVAEENVVAHTDLVAVVQRRRARHRKQQAVEQFDPAAITLDQRCQSAANTQVDPCPAIRGVIIPQVITLAVGDHFQRQLIVVAQEYRPLTALGDVRRLAQDVGYRKAVLLGDGHIHARHQGKMERHMAFIAFAEVHLRVFRPLIGLGQQHLVRVMRVHLGADLFQYLVGFRQVLVVGAIALDQVGNRIQPQPVHAHVEPESHHTENRLEHLGVIEVEVRLMRIETVPEVLLGHRIPGPVGLFGIQKDDPGSLVLLVGI